MNELTRLADKYNTDKGTIFDGQHNYTSAYYDLFNKDRENVLSLLEIGIFRGASVKMWRDFFPNAQIYCIDIVQSYIDNVVNEERIKPTNVDQSNRNSLKLYINSLDVKEFDIILDDGSHQMDHQQLSFGTLFPYIKSDGVYILEDISTSLNEKYTNKLGGYKNSTLNMFKIYEDTKQWESEFMTTEELSYLNQFTKSVDVYGWENTRTKENMSITSIIRKK